MAVIDITKDRPRYSRNAILMAKLEPTYNNNLAPTFNPDWDALWVEEVNFSYTSNNQTFNALQPYLGAKLEISGNDYVDISFKVALSRSIYVNKDQPFGFLFRACGMSREQIAAATGVLPKVIYKPKSIATNAEDSVAFCFINDGVQYLATGGRGTWEATLLDGGIPGFKFTFKCMFDGAVSDSVVTAPEFGLWSPPRIVNSINSSGLYLGSTLDLAALTFDNGVLYAHKGLNLNFGNTVTFDSRLGGDRMLITEREVTGSVQLDLRAERERALRSWVRNNTTQSLGFIHGLKDGALVSSETCVIYGPAVQFINPKIEDVNGVTYTGVDLRFRSLEKNNDATDNYGDNELSIIFA